MPERRTSALNLGVLLSAVEAAPPVAAADVLGAALAETVGAREVGFLIADFGGQHVIRLGHANGDASKRRQGRETAETVSLDGTPHGRALASQKVEVVTGDDGVRLYAPVTARGEAVGILELRLDEQPDEQTVADVATAAHALAYVVIANRRYTDLFEWGQRSVPLSLAAEIQHRLLPGSYTCEAGQFTLAAWLEPAGDVGGDTFDFALDRETLHLSITDAMGHTVEAALLASLVMGAVRNGRRQGVDLAEQGRLANAGLGEHARRGALVTGQFVRVNLEAGTAGIINAGHPPPLRLRDGHVEAVELRPDYPFGIVPGHEYEVQDLPLRAGDRLVFLTDGMLERNAAELDLAVVLAEGAGMHPREAIQHLTRAVLDASGGELKDDATAMCIDWHGGSPREREAERGADTTDRTQLNR
jgi:serine phosphatase RsbU (regulator of sigma subunit)